jgi:hypothetical protein
MPACGRIFQRRAEQVCVGESDRARCLEQLSLAVRIMTGRVDAGRKPPERISGVERGLHQPERLEAKWFSCGYLHGPAADLLSSLEQRTQLCAQVFGKKHT